MALLAIVIAGRSAFPEDTVPQRFQCWHAAADDDDKSFRHAPNSKTIFVP